MKKNLFEIKSEEVLRILSLHESRTKSQYLNIMEQATGDKGSYDNPYTSDEIQAEVDTIVDLIDGYTSETDLRKIYTILTKYQNKVALNDDNPIKPIKVTALSRLYTLYYEDEDIELDTDISNETAMYGSTAKIIKQLVNFIKTTREEKLIVPGTVAKTQFDVKYNHSFGNGAFKVPAKSVGKLFKDEAGTVNKDFVVLTTPDNKKVYFNCTSKTFSNGGTYVPEDNNETAFANSLLAASFLCNKPQVTVPPPVDGTTPPATDATKTDATKTDATNTQKSQTKQVNSQQFKQRTVTAINNVQKTLGVPQTGQLKNSDIDSLLTKLK
jgi:hypothetical protein